MQSKQKGFTLLEGLFSLFMVMMVMSGLAHTLGQAASVKKHTRDMDQAVEVYHALFTARNDIVSALQISEPSSGSSSSELELQIVNPEMSYQTRTEVLLDPLDPFEPQEQIGILYLLEDGLLKRIVKRPSEPAMASRLIAAKSVLFERNGGASPLIQIVLTVENQRIEKTRSLKVVVNSL